MKEDDEIHTDYVGRYNFKGQIYIGYDAGKRVTKNIFGKEQESQQYEFKQVKLKFCAKCGKVELYIDLNSEE